MDDEKLLYFKALLNEKLEELYRQSGFVLSELISQNHKDIEYLDRVSSHMDQVMKLRIKSRESYLIKKILNALERIENKTFGICEDCGEEISLRRLEVRPVASKCIDCKEEEERQELMVH